MEGRESFRRHVEDEGEKRERGKGGEAAASAAALGSDPKREHSRREHSCFRRDPDSDPHLGPGPVRVRACGGWPDDVGLSAAAAAWHSA